MLIGYCFIKKACAKDIVLEKKMCMVLSIKRWVGKDLRAGILFGIVCERPMGLYPLWHMIKDQWASIPYGTRLKTNGLASPMAPD
jgi:hypothetical protein